MARRGGGTAVFFVLNIQTGNGKISETQKKIKGIDKRGKQDYKKGKKNNWYTRCV